MIKGSDAQKQRPDELLWMLWFDEKSISNGGSIKDMQGGMTCLVSSESHGRPGK